MFLMKLISYKVQAVRSRTCRPPACPWTHLLQMNDSPQGTALSLATSNPVLGRLPPAAIAQLIAHAEPVTIEAGEVLVRQGDHSDCAFLILDGDLQVCVATAYGDVPLAVVSSGVLIGEIGVFAELPRTATVRAKTTSHALRFQREHLLQAGNNEPELLRSIITRLGGQIGSFNRAIGLYTDAVSALEREDFDLGILDALRQPIPELMDFSESFCRMAEQIVRRRAQLAEMASAAAIQRAMLPDELPSDLVAGGFDVHARMEPAREVGGDLYDVFRLDADHVAITIGDVCGKGVPASLFMAVTQTVMRVALRSAENLQAEIALANALLVAGNREMMFATFFCCVLNLRSGSLTYCNCGHNPPLLLRQGETTFEALNASGPPLGIDKDIVYTARTLTLEAGDRLFLYTDGVNEAEDAQTAQFGMERLEQTLLATRDQTAKATVAQLVEAIAAFSNGAPQFDDITCVALGRSGA
jgi:phosphoserine phosphatase RsbU/P